MAWSSSNRREQLPPDWHKIRARILKRDTHTCKWPLSFGALCGNPAHEVDHRHTPTNHSDNNLWALCPTHHTIKTTQESLAARPRLAPKQRSIEKHPNKIR